MAKDYEKPAVTVDIIIFTVKNDDLKILLVKRNITPFLNYWSLPGGFVGINESLDNAAKKKLKEKTGVEDVYLEQLYTFGNPKRDPRTRIITVAYFALVNYSTATTAEVQHNIIEESSDVKLFSIHEIPKLAFDHNTIIEYALQRLRWKLEYTTVAYSLLPEKFTLTDLQKIYEIIFDKKFDKRNFRKKIISLKILASHDVKRDVSHRPARLYSFKTKSAEIREIL